MMQETRYSPHIVYILRVLVGFQMVIGLAGGLIMVFDPTGKTLNLPGIFLLGTPFDDYLIPGLFLSLCVGLLPLLALLGLLGARWKWPELLNVYKRFHWGWSYTLYSAIVLILWMDIQVFFIGYWHVAQTVNALMGVLILVITLMPQVADHYRKEETDG